MAVDDCAGQAVLHHAAVADGAALLREEVVSLFVTIAVGILKPREPRPETGAGMGVDPERLHQVSGITYFEGAGFRCPQALHVRCSREE